MKLILNAALVESDPRVRRQRIQWAANAYRIRTYAKHNPDDHPASIARKLGLTITTVMAHLEETSFSVRDGKKPLDGRKTGELFSLSVDQFMESKPAGFSLRDVTF